MSRMSISPSDPWAHRRAVEDQRGAHLRVSGGRSHASPSRSRAHQGSGTLARKGVADPRVDEEVHLPRAALAAIADRPTIRAIAEANFYPEICSGPPRPGRTLSDAGLHDPLWDNAS